MQQRKTYILEARRILHPYRYLSALSSQTNRLSKYYSFKKARDVTRDTRFWSSCDKYEGLLSFHACNVYITKHFCKCPFCEFPETTQLRGVMPKPQLALSLDRKKRGETLFRRSHLSSLVRQSWKPRMAFNPEHRFCCWLFWVMILFWFYFPKERKASVMCCFVVSDVSTGKWRCPMPPLRTKQRWRWQFWYAEGRPSRLFGWRRRASCKSLITHLPPLDLVGHIRTRYPGWKTHSEPSIRNHFPVSAASGLAKLSRWEMPRHVIADRENTCLPTHKSHSVFNGRRHAVWRWGYA